MKMNEYLGNHNFSNQLSANVHINTINIANIHNINNNLNDNNNENNDNNFNLNMPYLNNCLKPIAKYPTNNYDNLSMVDIRAKIQTLAFEIEKYNYSM